MNTYQRNGEGAVINPPIIQAYEREMHEAQAACDFGAMLSIGARYNAERDARVKADEGANSDGLGWTDDDMRGGVGEDATALTIRPRFPDGSGQPIMPAGTDDAMLAEQQQLRAEMRELRKLMAEMAAQGKTADVRTDAPTPEVVSPTTPLGSTGVTAGPTDKPTPSVAASRPLGYTGVTAGQADPPNPTGPVVIPPPATDATDATGSGESS